jgi:hypothetical protein
VTQVNKLEALQMKKPRSSIPNKSNAEGCIREKNQPQKKLIKK